MGWRDGVKESAGEWKEGQHGARVREDGSQAGAEWKEGKERGLCLSSFVVCTFPSPPEGRGEGTDDRR